MGTKTIGLDEEAYERLSAEKREDESFSDVVKRVTEAVRTDWQRGFGKYDDADGGRLADAALASRDRRGQGLTARQAEVVATLADEADDGRGQQDGGGADDGRGQQGGGADQ